MFRSFLSLRYLLRRRTNLIGMVGVFVAVAALIMILSIMTGFLRQTRDVLRGSLSDIVILPALPPGHPSRGDPRPILAAVRAHPGARAATAQLVWGGILTQSGSRMDPTADCLADPLRGSLLAVRLVGIDVRSAERLAWPGVAAAILAAGGAPPPPAVQDEFDATALLAALLRAEESGEDSVLHARPRPVPVANALFPFASPPGYRPSGRPLPAVVLGEQLFHYLGLSRNAEIEIVTAVPDPATGEWVPNNRRFVVAGTFRTRDNEIDLSGMYLDRGELADFLGGYRPYTQVVVRLDDYEADGERVEQELLANLTDRGLLGGRQDEVRTWEQFRANLLAAIENERVLMGIMLSLVLVVAGFSIFAILSMMVIEKRRDIGILCALGATPAGVMQTFLMIAFWDGLVGSILGAGAGIWLAVKIDPIERWLSDTLGYQIFDRSVYVFDHIPSVIDPLAVLAIVAGAFLCSLLFAAVPAWRAARLEPLEALRYE
ncbi:MAG: FtsX-like permease family protein [Planctomycetota bacterium]